MRAVFAFLIVTVCLFVLVLMSGDLKAAVLAIPVCFAAGLALAHPSPLAEVMMLKRAPSWRDGLRALVFLGAAVLLICVLALLLKGPDGVRDLPQARLSARIVWCISLFWLVAAVLPLLVQIVRKRPAALGRALAGMGAGALMSCGIFFVWLFFGREMVASPDFDTESAVLSVISFPVGGLFAGLGYSLWRSAFGNGSWQYSQNRAVFKDALRTAGWAMAAATLLCVATAIAATADDKSNPQIVVAGFLCAVIGLAWVAILFRVGPCEPDTIGRGLAAILLLVIAIPISLFLPGTLTQSFDWVSVAALLLGPISVIVAVVVLAGSFAALRALIRPADDMVAGH